MNLTLCECLSQLIAIPSISASESALAHWCERFLQAAGFRTERQYISEQRFNVLASKGHGASLLLLAHLDTVPPDPLWEQDPFVLQQDDARFIGLGASDMKGGLAALLMAVYQMEPSFPLKIALTVDEELWSSGAWALIKSAWSQDIVAAVVPELSVDSEHEVLSIGRAGHFSWTLRAQSQRQHAAALQHERPAPMRLAEALLRLEHSPRAWWISSLESQSVGLSLPASAQAQIRYLSQVGESLVELQNELIHSLEGLNVTVQAIDRPTPAPVAYQLSKTHPLISWVQQAAYDVWGIPLPLVQGGAVADENVLATRWPVVSVAPVGGYSHRAGEWVQIKSLEHVMEFYVRLLQQPLPVSLTAGLKQAKNKHD